MQKYEYPLFGAYLLFRRVASILVIRLPMKVRLVLLLKQETVSYGVKDLVIIKMLLFRLCDYFLMITSSSLNWLKQYQAVYLVSLKFWTSQLRKKLGLKSMMYLYG